MNKKNIQIVVDISMSMRDTIGLVYVFLYEFLYAIQGKQSLTLSYQLTWFSGDTWDTVDFDNGRNYTDNLNQLFGRMKQLYLKTGQLSNEKTITAALEGAFDAAHGEENEQVLFLFTDYHTKQLLDLTEAGKVRKVFLFVPEGQGEKYRFRIVGKSNVTQKIMPILIWSMESLKEKLSEQDKDCMLAYLT